MYVGLQEFKSGLKSLSKKKKAKEIFFITLG